MIRLAIAGYGNLGKGVESAVRQNSDMSLEAFITRRSPDSLKTNTPGVPVVNIGDVKNLKGKVDAIVICAGSANDLPEMTPMLARDFNVIDSFDTHKKVPCHFAAVDKSAREGGNIAMISVGWDPGMFSHNRLIANAILPCGEDYTFWGKGVSQGHSDAVRRIEGVLDARQYTLPVESVVERIKKGETPVLTTREKHTRLCYVVAKEGADKEKIKSEIVNMKNYFDEYDTTVVFISKEEMDKNHSTLPHGGRVIRNGKTGFNLENTHTIEYSLRLDSNPEFTSSVILAYTRAMIKMRQRGIVGCTTVFDVAPRDLVNMDYQDIIAKML